MLHHGLFRLFQVNPWSNAELTQSSLRWPSGLPGLYPTLNCIFITQRWHSVLWCNLIYLTGYRTLFKIILGKQAGLLQGHEMAGWHHRLDGHEFSDGQRGLACCDSWGRKESDTTERLNWTDVWTNQGKKVNSVTTGERRGDVCRMWLLHCCQGSFPSMLMIFCSCYFYFLVYFFIVELTYNLVLVSGIQHSN